MIRTLKLTLIALAAIGLGLPATAAAQGAFKVDAGLAKAGKKVFTKRGCNGCHRIGKKAGAPDLAHVTDRRSVEWLKNWLLHTEDMLANDSTAQALLAEWNNVKMPNMRLTETEVDQVLNYIAQESQGK